MLRQVLAGTSQCNLINWAFLSTDSKLTLSFCASCFNYWRGDGKMIRWKCIQFKEGIYD